MRIQISQRVTRRIKLAFELGGGIDAYLPEIAQGYGEFFAPVLAEGETVFDTKAQLVLLRRSIDWNRTTLEELDWGVVGQVYDDDKTREEVARLMATVEGKLRTVRRSLHGIFSRDAVIRVGLNERFPHNPEAMYRRARAVQLGLENPDLGLEPVVAFSLQEDARATADLATHLEPEVSDLERVVESRAKEFRETVDAQSRRRQTIRTFDRNVGAIVRITQGIFRAAGREDLAARFRRI